MQQKQQQRQQQQQQQQQQQLSPQQQHQRQHSSMKREMAQVAKRAPNARNLAIVDSSVLGLSVPVQAAGVSTSSNATIASPSQAYMCRIDFPPSEYKMEAVELEGVEIHQLPPPSHTGTSRHASLEPLSDISLATSSPANVNLVAQMEGTLAPVQQFLRRSESTILSHMAFVLMLLIAMILYYVSETVSYLHLLTVDVFLFGGVAGNIALAIYVLPWIPADMWDALHTRGDDHGMAIGRRRWLRFCFLLFGCLMAIGAIGLYEVTTTSDLWIVRIFTVLVYFNSGISMNVFLYLTLLYRFPKRLLATLHKIHVDSPPENVTLVIKPHESGCQRFWTRMKQDATSYLVMFFMEGVAIGIYYVSETYHEWHHISVAIFFWSGTAGNIFLALVIVPCLPEGVWDAMHNTESDHGLGNDVKKRRRLIFWSVIICVVLQGVAMVIYQTTAHATSWYIKWLYPSTWAFGGVAANILFYMCIIPHFPRRLRDALRTLDEADCH